MSKYDIDPCDWDDINISDEDNYERDFNNFTPFGPNRFYMQIGDELWFDLESDFWEIV